MGDTTVPGLGGESTYGYLTESPSARLLKDAPYTGPNICTTDDPSGVKHNGTIGRMFTQSVRATNPADQQQQQQAAQKVQACAASPWSCLAATSDLQFKSAKGTGEIGPLEGSVDADRDGAKFDGKLNFDTKKKKKVELKADLKGEVCIEHKNGTKNGKGSWYTLEGQAKGVHFKLGVPDGELCIGNNDQAYPGFKGSIEVGSGE